MRVISGFLKGKRLLSPKGQDTRPTADRLKETLFNILQGRISESKFLDVFSGTGSIGIEALSRGADKVVFIDSSRECGEIINKNLSSISSADILNKFDIIVADFKSAIRTLGNENKKFDIIFLDPPYYNEFTYEAINAIVENRLLEKDGIIISEQGSKDPEYEFSKLEIYDIREYKTAKFVFYTNLQ
ncbi:MAG: 16S rRNA (guanine(966)-N(2))-methyltransferase RsmD [Defluviitaleaceae bacterium]|nr:16S rRNA (guanine(966)-N(2))-methyltransferase RsmD [Defluviitaleaceae bacterium]